MCFCVQACSFDKLSWVNIESFRRKTLIHFKRFTLFLFVCFCLFVWKGELRRHRERKRERGKERNIIHLLVHSQKAPTFGSRPVWGQELFPALNWSNGPTAWAVLRYFPKDIAMELGHVWNSWGSNWHAGNRTGLTWQTVALAHESLCP